MTEADRDVTESAIASEALLALTSIAVAVLRGPCFRLSLANGRFRELAGHRIGDCLAERAIPFNGDLLERAWGRTAPLVLRHHPIRTPSGQRFWNVDFVPLPPDAQGERGLLVVGDDVTPAVEATERAKTQARTLEAILAYAQAGIEVATSPDVRITHISDYANRLLGRSRPLLGIPVAQHSDVYGLRDPDAGALVSPNDLPLSRAVLAGTVTLDQELLITAASGERIPIHCSAGPIKDEDGAVVGGIMVWMDMRRLKVVEAELKRALEAKVGLLRELAHRVKNNFQMVSSLLQLQARAATDESLRDGLTEARMRIHALANIHERLYRRADFDGLVDLDVAIEELCRSLRAASDDRVGLELRLHPIAIAGDIATPLLLLLNELLSNAYKHAFPGDRSGTVRVSLEARTGAVGELAVADNGIGLPPDAARTGSLGLHLVHMLAEQIGGKLDIGQSEGTVFRIRFPI